ncbi:hypothetical protein [Actinokineospora xionganensis]|uniref:Uncharacterized protein n=1 Tax=Actinokineospora xionganensis TaxID=2684470 RepID=A0ABR7L141_9PSEU|nr:hypothetical protein [Actinokineospora xionganensis]MBC6446379.1 hypothetical protein [Actinokineospora xionganensis]
MVVSIAVSFTAAPASAAEDELRLVALSWSSANLDATNGPARNVLTFKVKEPRNHHRGSFDLATDPATALPARTIKFIRGTSAAGTASWVSTTGDESTYEYEFDVPRTGTTALTTWAVTRFAAETTAIPLHSMELTDEQLKAAFDSRFVATTIVDESPPTYSDLITDDQRYPTHAGIGTLRYLLNVQDTQSGVHSMALTLRGPGSATATGQSRYTVQASRQTVEVTLPAGAPAGTWSVAQVELVDNAGVVGKYTDLALAPLQVTGNSIVVGKPVLHNNPVNSWEPDAKVDLVATMASGSRAVSAKLDIRGGCVAGTPILPAEPGGTVSIPIRVPREFIACPIQGLLIIDQNGATAVYETWYQNGPTLDSVVAAEPPRPTVSNTVVSGTEIDWAKGGMATVEFDLTATAPKATWARLDAWAPYSSTQPVYTGTTVTNPAGRVTTTVTFVPQAPPGPYRLALSVGDEADRVTTFETGPDNTVQHADVALPAGTAGYTAVEPVRLMDTRTQSAPIGPAEQRTLTLAGVPAEATSVVLNVTAIDPTASSYLTVWPNGRARPATSNLNFVAGQTVPNLVTVPVVDGKVAFYNNAGRVHVVADFFGYHSPKSPSLFYPRAPQRILDTRKDWEGAKTRPGGQHVATVPDIASGQGGSVSVVLNVTVTEPDRDGYLAVTAPWGTATTSNLNFHAGQTVANMVIVKSPYGGTFGFTTPASAHVIVDVLGYHLAPHEAGGKVFAPLDPQRLMDTRSGTGVRQGLLGAGQTVTLPVAGIKGVPADATAITLNVTATDSTATSFLTVWPSGAPRPLASTVNFVAGATVPNLVTVPVIDGKVQFYNNVGGVHVIADVFGYHLG